MTLDIDRELDNADWTKQAWDLPPYRSDEFMAMLEASGTTLAEFRKLPVYLNAERAGLIIDDQWHAGHIGDAG